MNYIQEKKKKTATEKREISFKVEVKWQSEEPKHPANRMSGNCSVRVQVLILNFEQYYCFFSFFLNLDVIETSDVKIILFYKNIT